MKVGLKDINVTVELQNSLELIQLLQKATDQLEQLEKTIDEINQIRLKPVTELQS